MIIGNGLLASSFVKNGLNHNNLIIFCSGVSDSKETDDNNFNREKELLLKTINENKHLKIIYFSSILAYTSNTKYYKHKIEIEKLIKNESNNYIIFRVPQIIGNKGNKNNLFNFFKESILNDGEITIFENTIRALLDIEDLVKIVEYCKDKVNCKIVNISYIEKINVLNLVTLMSKHLNKTPKINTIINKNEGDWTINNSRIINKCINSLGIQTNGYTNNIIKKYI